jgi:hypothetical protein
MIGSAIYVAFSIYDKIFSKGQGFELIIISMIYFAVCSYGVWFGITLLKCEYYTIELNETEFIHKVFFAKKFRYSEIEDLYIVKMLTRNSGSFNILKIKIRDKKYIRLRINNLNHNQMISLLNEMKKKTNRENIDTKDKSKFHFWL